MFLLHGGEGKLCVSRIKLDKEKSMTGKLGRKVKFKTQKPLKRLWSLKLHQQKCTHVWCAKPTCNPLWEATCSQLHCWMSASTSPRWAKTHDLDTAAHCLLSIPYSPRSRLVERDQRFSLSPKSAKISSHRGSDFIYFCLWMWVQVTFSGDILSKSLHLRFNGKALVY